MKKRFTLWDLVIIVIGIFILFLIYQKKNPNTIIRTVKVKEYDTIFSEIIKENTIWKTKLIRNYDSIPYYLRDTIIKTKPFIAEKDTILNGDTIYVGYLFPMDSFKLQIKYKPDSIMKITEYKEVEPQRNLLEQTKPYLIGGFFGIIIGLLIK